ncbi:hypothetical protein KVR01_009490 [Diaporthe batatas]|uniref:uncharacterized protein n=1 Tax=Diaporthe batatas TaxID=748121 RepID=UPI001D058BC3|nr:uncharacterized protein KVR01_009490 [Diaporthe batatas]KAG8161226.1 hypothetical protein KVR01_009490 [Diaporthe batatas]
MAASDGVEETRPLINNNPELQTYYQSLESRIGYRLVLGGTRHFGYWDNDSWWPFPITPALRKMEQKMFERLNLPEGASVLDAGCGIAHWIPDASFEGIYTMETLVHATDLERVLRGFYRILKPGGRLVEHEYETVNVALAEATGSLADDVTSVVSLSAMPLDLMREGHLKKTLEDIGFVDVNIRDYSDNVRPMLRLFYWMAIIPYFFVKILCLEKYFVNTVAGAGGLRGQKCWRYISVSASKPGAAVESAKTK